MAYSIDIRFVSVCLECARFSPVMAYSSDIPFISVCPECVCYSPVMASSSYIILSVYVLIVFVILP